MKVFGKDGFLLSFFSLKIFVPFSFEIVINLQNLYP